MEPTYKMIGGDGREYGPVTLAELLAWLREGRIVPATQVWRSDADRWQPAANFEELEVELAQLPPLPGALPSTGLVTAGFWIRVGAHLVDQILLAVVIRLVAIPPAFSLSATPTAAEMVEFFNAFAAYFAISLLISGIYYTVMTAHFGATFGKMVFNLRVLKVDGSRIGYWISFFRFLGSVLSGLILSICYLMFAFRDEKRALHDLIAGTRVVFARE